MNGFPGSPVVKKALRALPIGALQATSAQLRLLRSLQPGPREAAFRLHTQSVATLGSMAGHACLVI